jgi:long-chain acyl-CoA synthetase
MGTGAIPGRHVIGSLLEHWARYHSRKTALVCGGRRIDFAEHHGRVRRCAAALQALAVLMGNCAELLELYRACALLGTVVVPISPLLQASGVATVLRDCDAAAVVSQPALRDVLDPLRVEFAQVPPGRWILVGSGTGYACYEELLEAAPPLADVAPVAAEMPFNIMYSSGTTGAPKGIVLTHCIRLAYALQFAAAFAVRTDSVVLHSGSLVFNGAFTTLMPAWLQGCTYVLQTRFDAADFIATVHREAITHVMLVPSQIAAILSAPSFSREALASLRMLCSLGAPLPHEHRQRLCDALPGAVYELYGLTEGFVTVLDGADTAAHPGSVGVPLPFHELRIIDDEGRELPMGGVGEIAGRGPLLMPGYYRQPELTRRTIVDGWLRSGDLGFVDDAGHLHLVDRRKDLIISGGVNVYPRDIEEVACRHPAIVEAAVFGVPDPIWGERPVAAVLLQPGAQATAGALCDWINANVAARYQRVQEVVVHASFPRNVAGKTLKRELRERWLTRG